MKDREEIIRNYLEWAYADPKYREFTTKMVLEFLETGKKPNIEERFREYLDGRTCNTNGVQDRDGRR